MSEKTKPTVEEVAAVREESTHRCHRSRLSKASISHWTTIRFCNGCPGGGARSMS